jgi:hypothetical protein
LLAALALQLAPSLAPPLAYAGAEAAAPGCFVSLDSIIQKARARKAELAPATPAAPPEVGQAAARKGFSPDAYKRLEPRLAGLSGRAPKDWTNTIRDFQGSPAQFDAAVEFALAGGSADPVVLRSRIEAYSAVVEREVDPLKKEIQLAMKRTRDYPAAAREVMAQPKYRDLARTLGIDGGWTAEQWDSIATRIASARIADAYPALSAEARDVLATLRRKLVVPPSELGDPQRVQAMIERSASEPGGIPFGDGEDSLTYHAMKHPVGPTSSPREYYEEARNLVAHPVKVESFNDPDLGGTTYVFYGTPDGKFVPRTLVTVAPDGSMQIVTYQRDYKIPKAKLTELLPIRWLVHIHRHAAIRYRNARDARKRLAMDPGIEPRLRGVRQRHGELLDERLRQQHGMASAFA